MRTRLLAASLLPAWFVFSLTVHAADPAGARYFPLREGVTWVHEKETVAVAQ